MAERKPKVKQSRSKTSVKVDTLDGKTGKPLKITKAVEKQFIQALFDGATVARACRAIGFTRQAIYLHRERHAQFAQDWEDAQRMGHMERCDVIRSTMWERAVEGYEETEARQYKILDREGKPTGSTRTAVKKIKKVDNGLLLALAKAHLPEEFRDNVRVEKQLDVSDALKDLMEQATQSPQNSLKSLVKA